jgi:hypothetical protein
MQSVSPVFTDNEVQWEHPIAKNQPEYLEVIGLPVSLQIVDKVSKQIRILSKWGTAIRFRLSDEERAAIAAGHDLVVTQLNFNNPITPLNLQILPDRTAPIFGEQVDLPTIEEIRAAQDGEECPKDEKVVSISSVPDASGDSTD